MLRTYEGHTNRKDLPVVPVRGGMPMLGSNVDATWNEGDIGDAAVDAGALKIMDCTTWTYEQHRPHEPVSTHQT